MTSFDISNFTPLGPQPTQVTVLDLASPSGAPLFSSGTFTLSSVLHYMGPWSSSVGIVVQVGPNGYNVGVDNIVYSSFGAFSVGNE